jgi:hypothetical protein
MREPEGRVGVRDCASNPPCRARDGRKRNGVGRDNLTTVDPRALFDLEASGIDAAMNARTIGRKAGS